MSIGSALYTKLNGLVGGRMYPLKLKLGASMPALTYLQVSDAKNYTHDGADKTKKQRWQISSWGATYLAAKTLAGQVEAAMETFTGDTVIKVKKVMKDNEQDLGDNDTGYFQMAQDFILLTRDLP